MGMQQHAPTVGGQQSHYAWGALGVARGEKEGKRGWGVRTQADFTLPVFMSGMTRGTPRIMLCMPPEAENQKTTREPASQRPRFFRIGR